MLGIALATLLWLVPATAPAQTIVSGLTRFARVAELQAAVTGTIEQVLVVEGARVADGDPLVRLDARVQAARVEMAATAARAGAALERAEAALAQARSRRARIARAVSRGGASPWERDEAEIAVTAAEAELDAARETQATNAARLAFEQAVLEQHTLRAPFAGAVLEVSAQPGGAAHGGEVLVVVAETGTLEAEIFLPVALVPALRERAEIRARLGAPLDREVALRLLHVDPRIEPSSGSVRALFRLPPGAGGGLEGVEVTIDVPGTF
ncbi:MAG: efflux RND transporter periplasmic adaptor subunit [Pseudomonadota bacterium]